MNKRTIEFSLGRVPIVRPPKDIYVLKKTYVTSHTFFEKDRFTVLGMTPYGRHEITLAENGTPKTVLHESLHNMGIMRESVVRPIATLAELRSKFSIGLRRRKVEYEEVPMTKEEIHTFLMRYNVEPVDINEDELPIYHLRLKS
jgi:hypothetical protein